MYPSHCRHGKHSVRQKGGKNMKKILSGILAMAAAVTLPVLASAASITAAQAENIALKDAGLSRNEVRMEYTTLDHDDGMTLYEVEFYGDRNGNYCEFSYEINADNGRIVEKEIELERLGTPVVKAINLSKTGKIKLSWAPVSGAVYYMVYRSTSPNGVFDHVFTTYNTSYTNTGAKAGVTYYYRVRAIARDRDKSSAFSATVSKTCRLANPKVSGSLSSGSPRLTWNRVSGAVSYKVYRSDSENGTYKLVKTTTSLSFGNTSAAAGRTCFYKVKAVHANSAANSLYSYSDAVRIRTK